MADIAREIRVARKSLRMNQAQFAEALGVSQGSVSKWEAGKEVPRYETFEKINALTGGVRRPRPTEDDLQDSDHYQIVSVPIVGRIMNIGTAIRLELQEVRVPVRHNWGPSQLEGWYLDGVYEDYRSGSLGIFAKLSASDRLDDLSPGEKILVKYESGSTPSGEQYVLAELVPRLGKGWALWPLTDRAKMSHLPLIGAADGNLDNEKYRPAAVLIGVYYMVSHTQPTDIEPD